MDNYVVCMDALWVRDSAMFDPSGLADDELENLDVCSSEHEWRWRPMEPVPFIAVIKAENERDACKRVAFENQYDIRCLFAIKV